MSEIINDGVLETLDIELTAKSAGGCVPGPSSSVTTRTDLPNVLDILRGYHRVSILFDGKEILGATTILNRPQNPREMSALLQHLIGLELIPDMPDPEVLGKYSL